MTKDLETIIGGLARYNYRNWAKENDGGRDHILAGRMMKDDVADHFSESVLITSRGVATEMLGLTEEYETAEGFGWIFGYRSVSDETI